VEKHVASAEAAAFEASMLKRLFAAGVPVPQLIAQENHIIRMSYLPGETLPDLMTRLEKDADKALLFRAADSLIEWLENFYRAVDADEVRGDVNGRNFIWDGQRWWGVDFEERAAGDREEDIGRLLAFVLTYDPPNTPIKISFADRLQKKAVSLFAVDPNVISHYRDLELLVMQSRRS